MQAKNQPQDVHALVTSRIIRQLEHGIVPWKHPFTEAGLPKNLITQKPYRGVNTWLLSSLNYPSNMFLTLKQLQDINGSVKKGQKSNLIVFWKWVDVEDKDSGQKAQVPFLRSHWVYNVDQCDGIPPDPIAPEKEPSPNTLALCEEILEKMKDKPEIKHKGKLIMYHPYEDYINLMPLKNYDTMENYYGALFHDLVHSTGHPKRLNRKEFLVVEPFVATRFTTEELVSDIGSSFLKFYTGIPMVDSNTNSMYIEGWLEKLKSDKKLIVYACNLAQRAIDFILNVKFEAPVQEVKAETDIPEDEMA